MLKTLMAAQTERPIPRGPAPVTRPPPFCYRCGSRIVRERDGTALCLMCGGLNRPMPRRHQPPRSENGQYQGVDNRLGRPRTPGWTFAALERPIWKEERP